MAIAKKSSFRGTYSTAFSFFIFLLLIVSTLVISGKLGSVVTPFGELLKSFASATRPKVTESFSDAFKTDSINTEKWTVQTTNARIVQTAANNLRMDIPGLSEAGKLNSARLIFKELIKDKGDFQAIVVVYRPIVTGEGTGVTGVRFASVGAEDDEGAVVQWKVNGSQSTVSFVVTGENGARLESQSDTLNSNIAVFRLDRINKKYRAYYKVGSDTSADVGWKALGQEQNGKLGSDGRIVLFTSNTGAGVKFPKVVGRFDSAIIRWEGDPKTTIGFSDAFSNGVVAKQWNVKAPVGATIVETAGDNLMLSVPAQAIAGKSANVRIARKEPIVASGKNFVLNAQIFKPKVIGEGFGASGISFTSAGSADDEAAHIQWLVSSNSSRVIFSVRAPNGTLVERASANVTASKLTLRLVRNGDKYTAFYRVGDSDSDFVSVGQEENASFGATGTVSLFVTNVGAGSKYPRVVARFDQVNGSMAK
jgi:hypothetical protein